MRLLFLHTEAHFFGGAERMLGYLLPTLRGQVESITVAMPPVERLRSLVPAGCEVIDLPSCDGFSISGIWQRSGILKEAHRRSNFDLVHAWAARDWDLCSATAWRCGIPAVGTLHDHPQARFHSKLRRLLMKGSARFGLDRVVCVSKAVEEACLAAGYPVEKLVTVHNGLPSNGSNTVRIPEKAFHIGFLGAFLPRKGFADFFKIVDLFAAQSTRKDWTVVVAGGAQEQSGRELESQIREQYGKRDWWHRVQFLGWVDSAYSFFQGIDLLVVPSNEFDPFPTVLLEAGLAGVPVLAARVGGVEEIVVDGETGWTFAAGDSTTAARRLVELGDQPEMLKTCGNKARVRVLTEFGIGKMVAQYMGVYSTVARSG